MSACIYDSFYPCDDCGRCKSRREIIREAEELGEIDEDYDEWRNDPDDNFGYGED